MQVCFCYEDVRYLVGGGEACMYVLAMKTRGTLSGVERHASMFLL